MMLEYTVQVWGEGGQFIAHAMPLDVSSSGRTPQDARLAVEEAVRCSLKTASDAGTLTEILEDCGYEQRDNG